MAIIARDESLTQPKGGGGKLNRSETVTVRLDPKLNYLCELAARTQRRTKSSFIEWSIAHALGAVPLPEVTDWGNDPVMVKDWGQKLWQVDEADRVMMLALHAPALLTHDEQLIWRTVREWGYFWIGRYDKHNKWAWITDQENLRFDEVRKHWDNIRLVAMNESPSESLPDYAKFRIFGDKGGEGGISLPAPAFDADLDDNSPF